MRIVQGFSVLRRYTVTDISSRYSSLQALSKEKAVRGYIVYIYNNVTVLIKLCCGLPNQ